MPAEFFALLLRPSGRYRHGCDPPASVALWPTWLHARRDAIKRLPRICCSRNSFSPNPLIRTLAGPVLLTKSHLAQTALEGELTTHFRLPATLNPYQTFPRDKRKTSGFATIRQGIEHWDDHFRLTIQTGAPRLDCRWFEEPALFRIRRTRNERFRHSPLRD